ncbi:hypothetical protein JCM8208_000838 [Rhodotorula glutinis]
MSAPTVTPQGASAQVLAFLAGDAPHDLASSLAQLAATSDPAEHLLLTSLVHQLVASVALVDPQARPDPHRLAALFTDGVFSHLAGHVDQAAHLADVWIDVVWQLDQELNTRIDLAVPRAPPPLAPAAPDAHDGMQVDDPSGAPPSPSTTAAERTKLVAAEVLNARTRLAHLCKALADSGHIPPAALVERLDFALIGLAGLVHDVNFFQRTEVRQRTALYYKQQKFNLLREESEGYSKLIVELLSDMGPPHSPETGASRENEHERTRRAQVAMDRVKNLIGNFDLDPTRTLDVILDAFSDHVVEHWQFFIDLLSLSPWAPKPRPSSTSASSSSSSSSAKDPSALPLDVGLESESGSDTIAQILGFKFALYQSASAPPDTGGAVPDSLYLTAALLVWHGLARLSDLWPHLSPDDKALTAMDAAWREDQAHKARSAGGANALAMAGALVDDEAPAAKPPAAGASSSSSAASSSTAAAAAAAASAAPARDPPNQRLGLLEALLSIGDSTHAFFILSTFPFLARVFPRVADLVNRLVAASIAPAYDPLSPSSGNGPAAQYAAEFTAPRNRPSASSSGTKAPSAVLPPPQQQQPTLTGSAFPNAQRGTWTFFFPRWTERVPRAQGPEGVVELLEKVYLPFVGIHVARDFATFTKIVRVAVADLGSNPSDHPRRTRWLDLVRLHLLPGIALLEHHPAAATEIWRVLSLYPIEQRFALYGEVKDSLTRRNPELGVRKAEAERDCKSILRRLSTDNSKKLGKLLARTAYTNPAAVFAVVINQIQSYDNLIVPVVEASRYLSTLSYDVLAYSILDALSSDRPKTKEDGTSIAMWLSGLATFTGQLYRRWVQMQPSLWLVLQYLVNSLVSGESKDLVVLRELIARMTAIEPFADLSDVQVLSLAGGPHLRSEVYQQTDLGKASQRAVQDALVKARSRLRSALLDKGLAVPLLVNIALQRQACLRTPGAHLKSLGALFDQTHAVLFQFTELLAALTSPTELADLVPEPSTLLGRFGLDAGVAFDLARPQLRARIRAQDDKEQGELQARKESLLAARLKKEKAERRAKDEAEAAAAAAAGKGKDGEGDVEMGDGAGEEKKVDLAAEVKKEGTEESGTPPPPPSAAATNGAPAAVNGESGSSTPAPAPVPVEPWHLALVDEIRNVAEVLPASARDTLGAPFFVTFWQLTLHDILYPKERYDAEITRLRALQRDVASLAGVKQEDKAHFVESVIATATGLSSEAAMHLSSKNRVTRRLTREKAHWFSNVKTKADRIRLADDILQYCVQPRARLSLPDAVFAHQLVKKLHSIDTPGFHTVVFYDRLLTSQVSPILFSCTENEARNYGRFIFDVLGELNGWYKDKAAYAEFAVGKNGELSGFLRSMNDPSSSSDKPRQHYEHADFQAALLKWHGNMVLGFIESFKSGGYMHIKNSILVLTKIAPFFPLDHKQGETLERSVVELLAVEKREDLTILAQGYKAVVGKRRKHWVNKPEPAPALARTASTVAKSASPASTPAPGNPTSARATPAPAPTQTTSRSALPSRPGAQPARNSQADVRPSSSSIPSRPVADARRHDPPPPTSSSLPTRPGANGVSASASTADSAADRLRAEALASKRASAASPATSAPGSASGREKERERERSGADRDRERERERERDRDKDKKMDPPPARGPAAPPSSRSAAAADSPSTSRPASRATSPRRDRDRDARDPRDDVRSRPRSRDRTRDRVADRMPERGQDRAVVDRERERDKEKEREREVRERSVESSHSRASASRDDRRSAASDRGGRPSDRDRERERERDVRDKDRDSRSGRGARDDRVAPGSTSSSSRRDAPDARRDDRSSRRDDDRHAKPVPTGPAASTSSSSRRADDERSRRDESHRERRTSDRAKLSREAEQREEEKERARQRDREREEQREKARKEEADRRAGKDKERDGKDRGGRGALPPKPTSGGPGSVDRLRPAPAERSQADKGPERSPPVPSSGSLADRARASLPSAGGAKDASPAAVSPAPAAAAKESPRNSPAATDAPLSIKGRGSSRLFAGLTSSKPADDRSRPSTSGSSSRRDQDDSSRKRPALADRLAPEEPKRQRTDESSRDGARDPPPHRHGGDGRRGGGSHRR